MVMVSKREVENKSRGPLVCEQYFQQCRDHLEIFLVVMRGGKLTESIPIRATMHK